MSKAVVNIDVNEPWLVSSRVAETKEVDGVSEQTFVLTVRSKSIQRLNKLFFEISNRISTMSPLEVAKGIVNGMEGKNLTQQ